MHLSSELGAAPLADDPCEHRLLSCVNGFWSSACRYSLHSLMCVLHHFNYFNMLIITIYVVLIRLESLTRKTCHWTQLPHQDENVANIQGMSDTI